MNAEPMPGKRPVVAMILAAAFLLAGCVAGPAGETNDSSDAVRIQATPRAPAVPPGQYKFDGQFSQVLAAGPYAELPFAKTFLASAVDGADIEIGVWRPDVPEGTRVPVIVDAGPYYGNLEGRMETKSRYILMLTTNYLPHGYAVAALSVRGTGGSGGCMDLMGNKESGDLSQAITWLGTQPWSNGRVGMIGRSYDGSTPWSVSAMGNEHLKTVVPVSGVPDVYGLMFRNGSAETRGPFLLNAIYYAFFARTDPAVNEREALHAAQGVVCPESWVGLGASMYSGATGARDPAGWWAERNHKPPTEAKWKGSVLMVQGLQDWNVDPGMNLPWADELNQSGLPVHQMLGQWGHEFPDQRPDTPADPRMRWDWAEILLHWWDYWLKDHTSVGLGPPVQIADSLGRWHAEEHFPPRNADWTTLHLSAGEALNPEPGPEGSILLTPAALLPGQVAESFRSLPVEVVVAEFTTKPFDEDLSFSGLPRLHVQVSPKGPTGHLAADLVDVGPQGAEIVVGRTIMNLLYADGTETMRPVTPNVQLVAKMEYQPLDVTIPAGHQLKVRVWEAQDEGGDRIPAIPPEPVELLFGGSRTSVLELPVIHRDASAYFMPPAPAS